MNENNINNLNINDVQNYVLPNITNLLKPHINIEEKEPQKGSSIEDSQKIINSIFQKISTSDPSEEDITSFNSLMDKTIELINQNDKSDLSLDKVKSAIKQLQNLERFNTALFEFLDVSINEKLTSIFKNTEYNLQQIQTKLEQSSKTLRNDLAESASQESPFTSRTSTPTAPDSASESAVTSPKVVKLSPNQMKREGPISLAWEQFKSFISRPTMESTASIEKTSILENNTTSVKQINDLLENIKTFLGPKHPIPEALTDSIKTVLGSHKDIFDKFKEFLEECKEAKTLNKQKLDNEQSPEISDIHNERIRNHRTNIILALAMLEPEFKSKGGIIQSYLAVFMDSTGFITNTQINTDSFQLGLVKDIEKNSQNSTTLARFLNGLNEYNAFGAGGFQPRYTDSLLFQRTTWSDIKYNGDEQIMEATRLLEFTFPLVEGTEEKTKVTVDNDKIFKVEVHLNFDDLMSQRSFAGETPAKLINVLTKLSGISYIEKNTYTMDQYKSIVNVIQNEQFQAIQSELDQLDKDIKEIDILQSKEDSNSDKYKKLDDESDRLYALTSKKRHEMEGFLKGMNIQLDNLFDAIKELDAIFDKNIEQIINFGRVALEFNEQVRNGLNKQLIAMTE